MRVIERVRQQVADTVRKYSLISKEDLVVCAVSGGKDSTVLLDVLKQEYNIMAVTIDVGIEEADYSPQNLKNLRHYCKRNSIPLHVLSFRDLAGDDLPGMMGSLSAKGVRLSNCAVCGTLKRHFLNRFAQELGADKLATGHNIDDISQSILMNQMKGNVLMSLRLLPSVSSGRTRKDMSWVPRIKPLYFVREEHIKEYCKEMGFKIVYDECPLSESAYRNHLKSVLKGCKVQGFRENIVSGFLSWAKETDGKPGRCVSCGGPSSSEICNACSLISKL